LEKPLAAHDFPQYRVVMPPVFAGLNP
jgi:hypothetical protein